MAGKIRLPVSCEGDNQYVRVETDITLPKLKSRIAEKFDRPERDIRLKIKKKGSDKWVLLKASNLTLGDGDQLEVTKKILGFGMRAIMPKNKLWKENGELVDKIRIHFLNDPPEKLFHQGSQVTQTWIFSLIQRHWVCSHVKNRDGELIGEHVPRFQLLEDTPHYAHVRVKFEAGGGNYSQLATEARNVAVDDATMVLDLTERDIDIQFTILHEFGHVLGLYHEHQHPDYIDVMEKFLDEDSLMELSGIEDFTDYMRQFGKPEEAVFESEYDYESIMHYPTSLEALKQTYQGKITKDPRCLEALLANGEISEKEHKILWGFVNHINHVKPVPSEGDKISVAEAYNNEYNKLHPPQQPKPVPPAVQIHKETPKKYKGITAPTMRDLSMLRKPTGGPPFKLFPKIAGKWRDIGEFLGLEDYLDQWKSKESDERIRNVFTYWKDNAKHLPGDPVRYAYSWDGLRNILDDAGCSEIADEYFGILETIPPK